MKKTAPKKSAPTLKFDTNWKYDPAPESADHVVIDKQYGLFINGKMQAPVKGKYFNTINPARETVLASVADATSEDVDKAVTAARNAHSKVWSKMKPAERGKYIYRIARIMQIGRAHV